MRDHDDGRKDDADDRDDGPVPVSVRQRSARAPITSHRLPTPTMLATVARQARSRLVASRPLAVRTITCSAPRRADPWPLPHTPEHLEKTRTPTDVPPPKPLERTGESVEKMRARLVYQSRKRGTLESDLLLSTFARDNLSTMTEDEMREYDKVRRQIC